MKRVWLTCLVVSVFLSGCPDDGAMTTMDAGPDDMGATADMGPSDQGPPDLGPPDLGPRTAQQVFADLLAFLGGSSAEGVTGYTYSSSGTHSLANFGTNPGDAAQQVSGFTVAVSQDVSGDRLHLDYMRTITWAGGPALNYEEVYSAQLGVTVGADGLFAGGGNNDMLSTRQASGRALHRVTNPLLIALGVVATPANLVTFTEQVDGMTTYEVLEVDDELGTLFMWVDPADGSLDRITMTTNDMLERDVPVEVAFSDWGATSGVSFPGSVQFSLDGEVWRDETRTSVVVNPTFTTEFDFPGGVSPTFDQSLADRGVASFTFFQGMTAYGIPTDANETFVQSTELAPGVFYLTGGTQHSLLLEQDSRLVLIEAPLYPERADAIIAWAASQFPGKPITHVVVTHHRALASGGLRSLVSAGATVVAEGSAMAFHQANFMAASTVSPDTLAGSPAAATFSTVTAMNAPVTLADGANPVAVHRLSTSHTSDALVVNVGTSGGSFIFSSGHYFPGGGGAAFSTADAMALLTAINGAGLNVPGATLVGAQGSLAPLTELENFVMP